MRGGAVWAGLIRLTADELELVQYYRVLDHDAKAVVCDIARVAAARVKNKRARNVLTFHPKKVPRS